MPRVLAPLALACCSHHVGPPPTRRPVIDRFSNAAGHLLVRAKLPGLPDADQPIDLDRPPFVTQGLAADGGPVRYYNFDVQRAQPAVLYRFTRPGAHEAIADQLDIVDAIPGEPGYNDFWRIAWVEVPAGYAANSVTTAADVRARGFHVEPSGTVIECPIVPRGTTARGAVGVDPPAIKELWYRGAIVTCLRFGAPLTLDGERVPTSPIYVTFAKPGAFRTEGATPQTHNVVMSLPGDVDYSPLWAVHVYDPAAFDRVKDAETALAAPLVEPNGPLVNCPIIAILPR